MHGCMAIDGKTTSGGESHLDFSVSFIFHLIACYCRVVFLFCFVFLILFILCFCFLFVLFFVLQEELFHEHDKLLFA